MPKNPAPNSFPDPFDDAPIETDAIASETPKETEPEMPIEFDSAIAYAGVRERAAVLRDSGILSPLKILEWFTKGPNDYTREELQAMQAEMTNLEEANA